MTSIIIAAHNEQAVIDRCLTALLTQRDAGPMEVIVAANGCTDQTATIARRPGVQVIETAQLGKANALNLGDLAAHGFPRVYLDADIVLGPTTISALTAALSEDPGFCAAVPARVLNVRNRPLIVRGYTAISRQHPSFRDGLFGRGIIAVSEGGRARFTTFPGLIADDLFLDSLFTAQEKTQVDRVCVVVETPQRTRDLIRRLVRVRRGNAQLRQAARDGTVGVVVRPSDRTAWLTKIVLRDPKLIPAGIIYVAVTSLAALLARRTSSPATAWARDNSTREA